MQIRVKLTYLDFDIVRAKVFTIYGWGDLYTKLLSLAISDTQILKVERVLKVSEENTEILD